MFPPLGAELDAQKLKQVPLLQQYSDTELSAIASFVSVKKFKAKKDLVTQGEPGEGFFILMEGECEVIRIDNGESRVVGKLKAGDYFGELALMNVCCP